MKQQSTTKKNNNPLQGAEQFQDIFNSDDKIEEIEEGLRGIRDGGKSDNKNKTINEEPSKSQVNGSDSVSKTIPKINYLGVFLTVLDWLLSKILLKKAPAVMLWFVVSLIFIGIELLEIVAVYATKLMFITGGGVNTPTFGKFPLLDKLSFLTNINLSTLDALYLAGGLIGGNHLLMFACVVLYFQLLDMEQGNEVNKRVLYIAVPVIIILVVLISPLCVQYYDALSNLMGANFDDPDYPIATMSPIPFMSLIFLIGLFSALCEYKLAKAFLSK